jgi:hypothetical protein
MLMEYVCMYVQYFLDFYPETLTRNWNSIQLSSVQFNVFFYSAFNQRNITHHVNLLILMEKFFLSNLPLNLFFTTIDQRFDSSLH